MLSHFCVGAINLITVLILIIIFIHYWLQYGKGLKEYCEYNSVLVRHFPLANNAVL